MPQLIELIEDHIRGLDDVALHTIAVRSMLATGAFDRLDAVLEGLAKAVDEAERSDAALAEYAGRQNSAVQDLVDLNDPVDGPRLRRALSARNERTRTVQTAATSVRVLAAETIRHLADVGGVAPSAPERPTHKFLVAEV